MRFQLPNPPGKPERRPVPLLMAVVPVVLGVAMAYFLRQVYMLALATFSPVMLLGSYVSDRRHGRKSHARQQAEYTERRGPAGVRHARLGRTAGRPSGVVSADIRASTNLRIALRMTDAAESADVIDAPDAAHIARATPGRGYVRLGHASLVPFQAGRIGGRQPGAAVPARPWVRSAAWPDLGRPELRRPAARQADDELTDLKVLVGEIRRAAAGLRIPVQPSPWLAPLPRTLLLRDLPGLGRPPEPGQAPAPFGLIDLPGRQRQQPAVISLDTFGHLMAAGAPRSGRSQLLRTIAAAVVVGFSSDIPVQPRRIRNNPATGLACHDCWHGEGTGSRDRAPVSTTRRTWRSPATFRCP